MVEVRTWHGQDPDDGHWGCPLRERWGLVAHQQMSPGWQQQLAFALTVTTSYEGAAALLRRLGHVADDATLHALAQKLGQRAEQQTQERLQRPPVESDPQRAASEVGVLMLDGWRLQDFVLLSPNCVSGGTGPPGPPQVRLEVRLGSAIRASLTVSQHHHRRTSSVLDQIDNPKSPRTWRTPGGPRLQSC